MAGHPHSEFRVAAGPGSLGAAVTDRNLTFLFCSSVRRERGYARGQHGYRGSIITA